MARTACVWIPRFELAVRWVDQPQAWPSVAAVSELAQSPARIVAATPAAEARGVREGQLLHEARTLCPGLQVLAPDKEAQAAAVAQLLKALAQLSPQVDHDGQRGFFAGLSGMERLWKSERAWAEAARAAFERLGFFSHVAVADGSLAARLIAERHVGIVCAAPGADAQTVAHLPLATLGPSKRVASLFRWLGLVTAGDVARLPKGSLSRRLGAEGAHWEALARGEAAAAWPSATKAPRDLPRIETELDGPTSDAEPMVFLFKCAVEKLLAEVARERQSLLEIEVEATLWDRSEHRHRIRAAAASLEHKTWVDLLRLWLMAKPFAEPVVSFALCAVATEAASSKQLHLWDKHVEESEAFARAVARLGAQWGKQCVVRPALAQTLCPEKRLTWIPAWERVARQGLGHADPQAHAGASAVLMLQEPPLPIVWQGGRVQWGKRPSLRVHCLEGPVLLQTQWWAQPLARAYFWLGSERGELLWVFKEGQAQAPYLHAWVD